MQEYVVNRPDEAAMRRALEEQGDNFTGTILRLAWLQGLRRDEITNLRWDEVSFQNEQIQLENRTVPLCKEMTDYLRPLEARWRAVRRRGKEDYVVVSERYRKPLQPPSVSSAVRRALDAVGLKEVRLIDLRHDYMIRQLNEHDYPYVARITGMDVRSLQLHFAKYVTERPKKIVERTVPGIDEFKLWKIMQAERDTPAGLAIWLTWHMGLTGQAIIALTWDQVDFISGVIRQDGQEYPMTNAIRKLLEEHYQKRGEDPHVLLTMESRHPMDSSRLTKVTRMALIRGGMEDCTLRNIWLERGRSNIEKQIVGKVAKDGPIKRSEVMELFDMTKYVAWSCLHSMVERGELVMVGCKYYLPGAVVPPEQQKAVIQEYLREEGFACRQAIAKRLQIESKQCSVLLRRMVEDGELVRVSQKYYLKAAFDAGVGELPGKIHQAI